VDEIVSERLQVARVEADRDRTEETREHHRALEDVAQREVAAARKNVKEVDRGEKSRRRRKKRNKRSADL
jgi:hypothetical protein